jgi:phage baseplate assembly protein W
MMASDAAIKARIYGEGWGWPLTVTPAGDVARLSGEDLIWQSVTAILETPLGTRPLAPLYGVPIQVYDPTGDALALAWTIGAAIERCEPRLSKVRVELLGVAPATGTVYLRLVLTPRGALSPLSRVFPFYRALTSGG